MKSPVQILILIIGALQISGCVILTDSATRLAYDLRDGALELETSDLGELTIEHKPFGVEDHYRVLIQTTDPNSIPHSALAVGHSGTSYHTRFVRVPDTLEVRKKKGESILIRLVKTDKEWRYEGGGETLKGNKAIELVDLK